MRTERTSRVPAVITAAMLVLAAASCAGEAGRSGARLIDVGSHRLEARIMGSGAPVVVMDTGIADTFDKLVAVQERLSKTTRVVAYNRAGYGRSEPGPLPRDCGREADELKTLLSKASLPGPYILVGHSLGGLNAQAFASRYPKDVAGMVLLDPPPLDFLLGREYPDLRALAEGMTAEWQTAADAGAKSPEPGERRKAGFLAMIASEHREMFGASAAIAEAIPGFGAIPLTVIASGKTNPAFGAVAEDYQKFWIEQNRLLSGKSAGGRFVLAEGSSHDLFTDAPGLVEREILAIVETARPAMAARAAAAPIVAECAEAMGGKDRVEAVRGLRFEVVYPDHDAEAVLHEIGLPNRLRTERRGEYVAVFDGRTGAMLKYDPARPEMPPAPQSLPPEAARGFETDLVWFFPAFLAYPAESAGTVDWNGTKCHKLIVTLPLGTQAAYLVDGSTFLVRMVSLDETYEGRTFHMEREWLDVKPADGILLPRRMTYPGREGKTAVAEIRAIEINPDFGPNRFSIPPSGK